MLNTIIHKPLETQEDYDKYTACAAWCNTNNATIEDKGDYYEVVAIPLPSLEDLKTQKLLSLKSSRDEAEVEPILYQGYSFDYDQKARERINAAIIALENAGTGASLTWTTADDKDVKVTASDLRGVIAQVALRSDKLHTAYREAKAKVEAAGSKEELDAIELEVV